MPTKDTKVTHLKTFLISIERIICLLHQSILIYFLLFYIIVIQNGIETATLQTEQHFWMAEECVDINPAWAASK